MVDLQTEPYIPDILPFDKAEAAKKPYTFKSFSVDKNINKDVFLLDFLRQNSPIEKEFLDLKKMEREQGRIDIKKIRKQIIITLSRFCEIKQRFFANLLDDDYPQKNEDFNRLRKNNRLFNILKVMVDFNEHIKEWKGTPVRRLLESVLCLDIVNLRLEFFLKNVRCKICALEVPIWQFKAHDENCYQYNMKKDEIILINDKLLECIREIKNEADVFDYKQIINSKKQFLQENYKKMKSESLKNSLNKTFYGSSSGRKSDGYSTNMNSYLYANKTTYENQSNNKSRFFNYKRNTNESFNKCQNDSWGDLNKQAQTNSMRPLIDASNKKGSNEPVSNFFGALNVSKKAEGKDNHKKNKHDNLLPIHDEKKLQESSDAASSENDSEDNQDFVGDKFRSFEDSEIVSKGDENSKRDSHKLSGSKKLKRQYDSSNNIRSFQNASNLNINAFRYDLNENLNTPLDIKDAPEKPSIKQNDTNEAPEVLLKNQTSINNIESPDKNVKYDQNKLTLGVPTKNNTNNSADNKTGESSIVLNKFKTSTSRFKSQADIDNSSKSLNNKNLNHKNETLDNKHRDEKIHNEDKKRAFINLEQILKAVLERNLKSIFNTKLRANVDDKIIEVTSEYNSSEENSNDDSQDHSVLLGDKFDSMNDNIDKISIKSSTSEKIEWKDTENNDIHKDSNVLNKSMTFENNHPNQHIIEPSSDHECFYSDGGYKERHGNIIDQIESPFADSKDTGMDKKDTTLATDAFKSEKKGWLNHGSKKLLNNIFCIEAHKKFVQPHNLEYNPETNQFDQICPSDNLKTNVLRKSTDKKDLYTQMNKTYYGNQTQQTMTKSQIWNFMSKASKTEYHKGTIVNELDEKYYFYLFNKDIIKYKEHLLTHPYIQNFFYDQEFLVHFDAYENKFQSQNKKRLLLKLKALIEKRIAQAKQMMKFSNNIEILKSQIKEQRVLREAISRSFGNFSVLEDSASRTNDKNSRKEGVTNPVKNELLEKSLLNSIKKNLDTNNTQNQVKIKNSINNDEKAFKANKKFRKLKRTQSDSEFVAINTKQRIYEEKTKVIDINDFIVLKELGAGAFGKVFLVKHKTSEEFYAMKVLKLNAQHDEKYISSLLNEIKILNIISSDFLVKAYFSFIHHNSLCIVMEYMIGGDMRGLLEEWGILDNDTTKYYAAQLILAVESLHTKKVIHRDLKPENLLLNNKGQLKLADFGLSEIHKKIQDSENDGKDSDFSDNDNYDGSISAEKHFEAKNQERRRSSKRIKAVGTPDYIAPEILFPPKGFEETSEKYCEAVDWWAVGCLIYEFIVGISAFGAMTLDEVFNNIKQRNIEWPEIGYGEDQMTPEAKDLIERFLDPDPVTRLGTNGLEEIKTHKFFNGIDWSKLHKMNSPLNIDVKPNFKKFNIKGSFRLSKLVPSKTKHNKKISSTYKQFKMNRVDLLHDFNVEFYHSIRQKYHALQFQKQLSSKNLLIGLLQ